MIALPLWALLASHAGVALGVAAAVAAWELAAGRRRARAARARDLRAAWEVRSQARQEQAAMIRDARGRRVI